MKIKDLIKNVNKTKQFEDKIFIGDFAEKAFDLQYIQNWDDQTRLIAYYLGNWYCTDSCVGYKIYFFDDKPVAVSSQLGRKCTEEIEWISKEDFKTVKDYIMSFAEEFEDSPSIVDLEQDFGTEYKVEFYCQMYEHHKNNAVYKNEKVKVLNHKDSFNDGKYNSETVQIQYLDGKKEWIETKLLSFPFNLQGIF